MGDLTIDQMHDLCIAGAIALGTLAVVLTLVDILIKRGRRR